MRHFGYLTPEQTHDLFALAPQNLDVASDPKLLSIALGATLYSPATRTSLDEDARRAGRAGVTSHVWCLEDSIPDSSVATCEREVAAGLRRLGEDDRGAQDLPMIFIRVRTSEQVLRLASGNNPLPPNLIGFVLPKVESDTARTFLTALEEAGERYGRAFYAMPIIESRKVANVETRRGELAALRRLFDEFRALVLGIRVGGTDLCGIFGLRRDRHTVIWDISVVRECIADIINVFGRDDEYVISGPAWEHFDGSGRLFRPQLRQTPFARSGALSLRQELLEDDLDELLREVSLDATNGLTGKTVVHPSHVSVVNALATVSREEYQDALAVQAEGSNGGVIRSEFANKMNEARPHALWAERVLRRASVYGVLRHPDSLVALLAAGRGALQNAYAIPGWGSSPAPRRLPLR